MPPKPPNLTLSKEAFDGKGGEKAATTGKERPSKVRAVMATSAGISAIDALTMKWKAEGLGKDKEATKLLALIYEMQSGEQTDAALDSLNIAKETPGNLPVTLVHPLSGGIDEGKLPESNAAPSFAQLCFALPMIQRADDITKQEDKWLALLKAAGERNMTLELALNGKDEQVREKIEELLGKAWDQEVGGGNARSEANERGVKFVIDAFAAPPMELSASQMGRSKEFQSWSDFVSRLALHPRVYLKLSPLPMPNAVPGSLTSYQRPVDVMTNNVPIPGAGTVGETARAVHDAAAHAAQAGGAATISPQALDEQKQRIRVFLETVLDAFGEERLIWASYLASGSTLTSAATGALSEPEQWLEMVLESLQAIGVGQSGIDNIFSNNASKCYQI